MRKRSEWLSFMLQFAAVFIILNSFQFAFADSEKVFEDVRVLLEKNETVKALKKLESMDKSKWSTGNQSLYEFALGQLYEEEGQYENAIVHLKKSIALNSKLKMYAHYLLGKVLNQMGRTREAKVHLQITLSFKPPRKVRLLTRYELSKSAFTEGHWKTSYHHLKYLQRRWRNTTRHGEILWLLTKVELKRERKKQACRWASKFYSRYPTHPLVYDWGIDLHKVSFEGEKLGCVASDKDMRLRIRRLQWAGESQRARAELDILRSLSKSKDKYELDSMMVQYLIQEGFAKEALKILNKYYDEHNNDFKYLMALGKAAARSGEYSKAVGAYYKAYQKGKGRSVRRKALFSAAFLSYQYEDYDGAIRKFQEFVKNFKKSGLRRDAEWYMAWIQYLKADYEGAEQSFVSILEKKKRRKRYWRQLPEDKINYWLAMSYLRQEKYDQARALFYSLSRDSLMHFYALASFQRLKTLPAPHPYQNISSLGLALSRSQLERTIQSVQIPTTLLPETVSQENQEEDESEATFKITPEEEEQEAEVSENAEDDSSDEGELKEREEEEKVTVIFSPRLRKHLERAKEFMRIGQYSWAKLELYEMERKTRNPTYLKQIMKAFSEIQAHNRTAYISSIYFSGRRKRYGIDGERWLWEQAYPQAFGEAVTKNSGAFAVPSEFVWSIMRAESFYKKDIESPVGAKGLMQIMPNTANQVAKLMGDISFNVKNLKEPDVNVRIGTRYLSRLLRMFNQQIPLAAAGYNAGPHRVHTWLRSFGHLDMDEFIEHIPYVETRNYVKKVVRNFGIYNDVYSKDKNPITLSWLTRSIPIKASASPSLRESWEPIQ